MYRLAGAHEGLWCGAILPAIPAAGCAGEGVLGRDGDSGLVSQGFWLMGQQPKTVLAEIAHPYCLVPPGLPRGNDPPDSWKAQWVPPIREWAAPGIMQFINAPIVRKSAALLNYGMCRCRPFPHFGVVPLCACVASVVRTLLPHVCVPLSPIPHVLAVYPAGSNG